MTKLASTYARSTGLFLDKPNIKENFYPHPHERYITLQTGAKQQAKQYSYWQEIIAMLKPILDANKIAILLLGDKDDPVVNGVYDLRGKTSWLQSNYLIKRSLCHMGNDSFLVHCAGWNYRPIVALYGSTDEGPHGPFWSDVSNTILLTSHRMGGRPTFVMQEVPKTINFIRPETVANAVLRLLGITDQFAHTTLSIGPFYSHTILELVPNTCPIASFCPELPITVRMDLAHNEEILVQLLQTGRKVHLITKREINPQLLAQAKPLILSYSHEIVPGGEPPVAYADAIKALFPTNHAFYTRVTDDKVVADIRFTYFDHVTVSVQRDPSKDDLIDGILTYLNRANTPENRLDISAQLAHSRFKTNHYILSDGRVFLSHAHAALNQPIDSLANNTESIIDDPALYKDANHFLITHVLLSRPSCHR